MAMLNNQNECFNHVQSTLWLVKNSTESRWCMIFSWDHPIPIRVAPLATADTFGRESR